MDLIFAETVLFAWIAYGPATELLLRSLRVGAIYRGDDLLQEICLTFDDGPDPDRTPKLLDLLEEGGAKAVFFVVGEHAEKHPELLREIRERGHAIGNHTFSHVNLWFTSPWRLRREIAATSEAVERATGEPTRYFRPPWGRMNLFSLAVARRLGHEPVLWTFPAFDWRAGDPQERAGEIVTTVQKNLQNGAIVLMHDFGRAQGVPDGTLRALQTLLPRIREIGFSCSLEPVQKPRRASVFGGEAGKTPAERLTRPILGLWETVFNWAYGVFPMTRIFRLGLTRWHFGERFGPCAQSGPLFPDSPRTRSDVSAAREPLVRDGDLFVELHFQNRALRELADLGTPEQVAVRSLKEARQNLTRLARILLYDTRYQGARGVFGVTLMHRGMERLGFHVEPVSRTLGNRYLRWLLRLLMAWNHPLGRRRLAQGRGEMEPRLVWMTRDALVERYFQNGTRDSTGS